MINEIGSQVRDWNDSVELKTDVTSVFIARGNDRTNSQNINNSLISSVSIALSAGTNYAFSIYSVQLGHRLKLSSTTLNLMRIAGNLGMYISSPIVGRIIDRYGTMKPLLVGMILISIGYNTLHELYMNLKPD
ncbi:hypothetical protein Pst134EA_009889 [Puccinia striiformis f. sp. tritici]|uniref:hypothetical protein n=1 Tax=Puccinia striiformis f. sp. tritici TaxID=168172 RepID=UPI002007C3BB|nr:hypothetical protein Pst134EA_009889 [Puccinia striiformis f. sp. tritici]KAH9469368.1 hypothetical protein Pst134EA_009889 [Puccinia striiformis f. sp. tritici]